MQYLEIDICPTKYLKQKLSNTAEWRTSALHFEEFGTYCPYMPNPAPNSPWTKFWLEEKRRCLEGYHCGWDYITGYYYYYLNYGRMIRNIPVPGTDRLDRVEGFADVFDGDYEYFHYLEEAENTGKHALVLKRRGSGYSFKGASMLCRNFFMIPMSRSYAFAYQKEYLIGDGLLSKTWDMVDFMNQNTPFSTPMHKRNTDLHKRNSYMGKNTLGQPVEKGLKSEILGVSLKDDPDKARGKRGKLLLYEEAGKFPDMDRIWEINRQSVEESGKTYGLQIAYGTGGTMGEGARSLEEMFDKPAAYNILGVDNIWEKSPKGKKTALFVPAWKNWHYDQDGNTLVEQSVESVLGERIAEKAAGKTEALYLQKCAELPMIPSEAVMRVLGTFFPVQILKEQKADVLVNVEKYVNANYLCTFKTDPVTGETYPVSTKDIEPIREYPITSHRSGCVEIFTMPQRNSQDVIPFGTYIAGIDPLDDDYSSTSSMFACYVFNRYTRQIVAEYITRDEDVKHTYEQCRLLLKYYNAVALYEQDKKGLYTYFERRGCLHLLADTPYQLRDREWKPGTNKSKGVSAIRGQAQGRNALKSWLREPLDKEGEILGYHRIYSLGLLNEMIQYDSERNFDRVDAMSMCMLLDDTMYRSEQAQAETVKKELDDPYWDNFFKNKRQSYPYNVD